LHERPDAPVPNYFAELDRVTRDDVIRAARTVFRPETRFEAVHRPFITVARGVRLLAAGLGLAAATLALRRHVGLRSY